jgi:outer membrane protein OmpA-like peptidoglycan-associated protein
MSASMSANEANPGLIRGPKRDRQRRTRVTVTLLLVPLGIWFALMQAYIAFAPVDDFLQDRDADSVVALPNGTTLLEPRGTPGREMVEWLDAHLDGSQQFEVGGNQFEGDTAILTTQSIARIARLAMILKAARDVRVAVIGYSATEQDAALTDTLSLARANSVRDELIQSGLPAARVSVEGHSTSDLIASNDTSAGRQRNARVAVFLSRDRSAA